jgi:hypothetical protein
MDKTRYEFIKKKYGEYAEKISELKKKKLAIIAKYRGKIDEKKLQKLRNAGKELNL